MTTNLTILKLDKVIKDRLQRLATDRGRKLQGLIRDAIQQYVDREESSEQSQQQALKGWNDFQVSGLHVAADEADAWLSKLEAGEDVEAPECHD